eukprot:scaffold577_cov405-Prasinococcus_capsulatus_cf.AAC.5
MSLETPSLRNRSLRSTLQRNICCDVLDLDSTTTGTPYSPGRRRGTLRESNSELNSVGKLRQSIPVQGFSGTCGSDPGSS